MPENADRPRGRRFGIPIRSPAHRCRLPGMLPTADRRRAGSARRPTGSLVHRGCRVQTMAGRGRRRRCGRAGRHSVALADAPQSTLRDLRRAAVCLLKLRAPFFCSQRLGLLKSGAGGWCGSGCAWAGPGHSGWWEHSSSLRMASFRPFRPTRILVGSMRPTAEYSSSSRWCEAGWLTGSSQTDGTSWGRGSACWEFW
jgi:hypothetical protein